MKESTETLMMAPQKTDQKKKERSQVQIQYRLPLDSPIQKSRDILLTSNKTKQKVEEWRTVCEKLWQQ